MSVSMLLGESGRGVIATLQPRKSERIPLVGPYMRHLYIFMLVYQAHIHPRGREAPSTHSSGGPRNDREMECQCNDREKECRHNLPAVYIQSVLVIFGKVMRNIGVNNNIGKI